MSWNSQHWRGRQSPKRPTAKQMRQAEAELHDQLDEWYEDQQWEKQRAVRMRLSGSFSYRIQTGDEDALWGDEMPTAYLGSTLDFATWAALYAMGGR